MNIAMILSGGIGSRLGMGMPKQYITVNNKPIISYCVDTLDQCEEIDGIWIVADIEWRSFIDKSCPCKKVLGFSDAGRCRQHSIWRALIDMGNTVKQEDCVIICDAVRPLLTEKLLKNVLYSLPGHDGVMPAIPIKDTVYYSEDGKRIASLMERSKICAGQSPEAFVYGNYFKANHNMTQEEMLKISGSAEPAVLAGMDVLIIEGDEDNFKITTKNDLDRFRMIMERE